MEPVADVLKQCTLFKDMTHKDIDKFLKVSRFSILSKELSRMREEGDLFWRELNRRGHLFI